MSNVWLQRKLNLIHVINELTDTEHDDISLSIVLNVLWTADDEDREYLSSVLQGMTHAEFDGENYSKAFLEQLDLICTIPVPAPEKPKFSALDDDAFDEAYESSETEPLLQHDSNHHQDETTFEDEIEEDELDDEDADDVFDEPVKPSMKSNWLIFLASFSMLMLAFKLGHTDFDMQAVYDAVPKWIYFWFELFFVITVLISVGYLIRNLATKLADYLTTLGFMVMLMPLLWLLKGIEFTSTFSMLAHGVLFVLAIASISRILSYQILK